MPKILKRVTQAEIDYIEGVKYVLATRPVREGQILRGPIVHKHECAIEGGILCDLGNGHRLHRNNYYYANHKADAYKNFTDYGWPEEIKSHKDLYDHLGVDSEMIRHYSLHELATPMQFFKANMIEDLIDNLIKPHHYCDTLKGMFVRRANNIHQLKHNLDYRTDDLNKIALADKTPKQILEKLKQLGLKEAQRNHIINKKLDACNTHALHDCFKMWDDNPHLHNWYRSHWHQCDNYNIRDIHNYLNNKILEQQKEGIDKKIKIRKRAIKYLLNKTGKVVHQIKSKSELVLEGKMMKHCVGSYSLQDGEFYHLALPNEQATAQVYNGELYQICGVRNECVSDDIRQLVPTTI